MMTQPSTLTLIPKLIDLVSDPSKVSLLPAEAIASLRGELARLDTMLLTRLLSRGNSQGVTEPDGDRLLSAKEAAAKLGTTMDWLYRHADGLPFTVRVGKKQVRFSAVGIERYIRQRAGR